METTKTVKAAKWGYIISSLIFCVAGSLLIIFPGISATVFCYVAGGLLIACGIIKIIGYFSKDLYRLAFQFDLAFGILSTIVGLVMIFFPTGVISILHFVVGILVLTDSLFKIQTSIDAKRFGLTQWWLIAIVAILAGAFGLFLMINPFSGAVLMMILIGIALLMEGILNLCVAVYAIKVMKAEKPNIVYYETYTEEGKGR